jgi:hypothetical protein
MRDWSEFANYVEHGTMTQSHRAMLHKVLVALRSRESLPANAAEEIDTRLHDSASPARTAIVTAILARHSPATYGAGYAAGDKARLIEIGARALRTMKASTELHNSPELARSRVVVEAILRALPIATAEGEGK